MKKRPAATRSERLVAELKANLMKRKQQTRARARAGNERRQSAVPAADKDDA